MFKCILLPTDGSELSERAVLAGIDLARENGAAVIGLHVTPNFHVLTYRAAMLEDTPEQFVEHSARQARRILDSVAEAAGAVGVRCSTEHAVSDGPYEAIIESARRNVCDLIVMAAHGRRGIRGLLLGSETQKVLVHSSIPVLVFR
jgi:nucleotide-binding universal stress UspA family protein